MVFCLLVTGVLFFLRVVQNFGIWRSGAVGSSSGSYPEGRWFKSSLRNHGDKSSILVLFGIAGVLFISDSGDSKNEDSVVRELFILSLSLTGVESS